MAQSCAGETKASKHVCFQRVSPRPPPPGGGTRTRDMSASREYWNTRMPGSSVRSRTPRLRTPSLGVEVWAISSAGCVSMDDIQLLYSCPIRPGAAFHVHDDQSEAVMMRWASSYRRQKVSRQAHQQAKFTRSCSASSA